MCVCFMYQPLVATLNAAPSSFFISFEHGLYSRSKASRGAFLLCTQCNYSKAASHRGYDRVVYFLRCREDFLTGLGSYEHYELKFIPISLI